MEVQAVRARQGERAGGTWAGYSADPRSAAYGGYGADTSTRIAVGAGETIMMRHLNNLYDLLGMRRDKPGARWRLSRDNA